MPKYVIERDLPGAGKLSLEELKAVSQKSCGVLRNLVGHRSDDCRVRDPSEANDSKGRHELGLQEVRLVRTDP
jgi:hypothetical protein